MKVNIAVSQFEIAQFQPEKNIAKAETLIKTASKVGADIIVFPEDFITGPLVGKKEYADFEGKYRKLFEGFARTHKIDISMGSIIEGDTTGLYNTAYYIDAMGKVRGKYRKINLWLPERKYLNPGNKVVVFNTKFGKIGLTICWDLIFPEIFRRMAVKGVDIVLCPSYWCVGDAGIGLVYNKDAEILNVNSLCTARAFENEIVLVYANAAGNMDIGTIHDKLIGQSQITVPFRGALKLIPHNKEELFIQEVDTAILGKAEKAYKIREDVKSRVLY